MNSRSCTPRFRTLIPEHDQGRHECAAPSRRREVLQGKGLDVSRGLRARRYLPQKALILQGFLFHPWIARTPANPANTTAAAPVIDVQQLVADNDLGGRSPGPKVGLFLLGVALAWSLFQLWIASPLPFTFGVLVFNDTESRSHSPRFCGVSCVSVVPGIQAITA